MVRHIVLWNLKETLSESERRTAAARIKTALEALPEEIPGIVSLTVHADMVGGNRDLALDSVFESEEALRAYVDHPAHVRVATEIVRPATQDRASADYHV